MNTEHLRAFVWLRWRIRLNQLRKGGIVNQVLLIIAAASVAVAALGLFVGGFFAGLSGLPAAPHPVVRLLVWDGVVAAFLFAWAAGLLAEIRRTDPLTLDKFLHLPASPAGVFLVNYVSSLFSVSLGLFAAAVGGLLLGQLIAVGPVILLAVPLVLAFAFAVTAVTYQLQGWLAVLTANPRRRRTVLVLATFAFILLVQTPNLFNLLRLSWKKDAPPTAPAPGPPPTGPTVTVAQGRQERDRKEWEQTSETAWLMNAVIPPGWLPLGAASLADGGVLPALLGTLGFTLVGGFCLRRAYRTTVKYHTGQTQEAGGGKPAKAAVAPPVTGQPTMAEWRLPWVGEYAAAVATAALRGLLRAPEARMMLLAPALLVLVFGGLLLSVPTHEVPGLLRAVIAVGAPSFILVAGVQLSGNLFGYDRGGFRAYVLSPVPRRDVLLGRNLANAPFGLGMAVLVAGLVGVVMPMRWDHYPAVMLTLASLYLLCCLLTNALSVVAPVPIAPGAMNPRGVQMVPLLWQFGFLFAFPVVLGAVMLPFGVEAVVEEAGGVRGWPVALVLSVGVFAGAAVVYRALLGVQGDWLQSREQDILLVVTSKSE